jgi:tRNA threonylcarbamoyladenosine biosynthesis protein TsaE
MKDLFKLWCGWLMVFVWCVLIFWWSSIPHLAIATGVADFWTRKPAHVAEYAVLFLLLYRAINRGSSLAWRTNDLFLVALLAVLYAASDEIHQHFVIGRSGKVLDVGIDTLGVLLGLGLLRWWIVWQRVTANVPAPAETPLVIDREKVSLYGVHEVSSVEEMHQLAQVLATALHGGDVVALSGELGAGKTTFTQGLAAALGITGAVASPTFVLERQYVTNRGFHLHHFDWYRLERLEDVQFLGVEELFGDPRSVVVIEWPERALQLLPQTTIHIRLEIVDEYQRRVHISKHAT